MPRTPPVRPVGALSRFRVSGDHGRQSNAFTWATRRAQTSIPVRHRSTTSPASTRSRGSTTSRASGSKNRSPWRICPSPARTARASKSARSAPPCRAISSTTGSSPPTAFAATASARGSQTASHLTPSPAASPTTRCPSGILGRTRAATRRPSASSPNPRAG